MDQTRCDYPRCQRLSEIIYLEKNLCSEHFAIDSDKLRRKLGLPEMPRAQLYAGLDRKELRELCRQQGLVCDKRMHEKELVALLLGA